MPVSHELTLYEANNEVANVTIYEEGTDTPQDLTGATVEIYLKASASATDASATKLSTATGEITITDAADGEVTVVFPAQSAGVTWWRIDAVISGQRRTAAYGRLIVVDM